MQIKFLMKLKNKYFFGIDMKKLVLLLFLIFLYSPSFANNHNDDDIEIIQGVISDGLAQIGEAGQSAGDILGGEFTFFDFDEQVSWNTDLEACVKTPEIPSAEISFIYPSGLHWSQVCGSICYPYLRCGFWSCDAGFDCSDVCTGIWFPSGIDYSEAKWKIFPGISSVRRCQNVEAVNIRLGGEGILQYSPDAALFSAILKGEMYGFPLEYGIECALPLSGDFEIKFDMISRSISSIDNTDPDKSPYSTDIGFNAPEFNLGNIENPSEILVPADIEVEPSYEFKLQGSKENADGLATDTEAADVEFGDSSVSKPRESLKNQSTGETDSSKNTKKGSIREKVMKGADDSPFCEIVNTFPSITPPGIAADAVFNIAPLQGSMAVGISLGISPGGASAGNFSFALPTLTLEQTLLSIENGKDIGVAGGMINILPKNPVNEITESFVNEIVGFARNMEQFFGGMTNRYFTGPFCDSGPVKEATKWIGKGIGDIVSNWGGGGGDIFQIDSVCSS